MRLQEPKVYLISGYAGAGKDTFFSEVEKLIPAQRISFADPLKKIARDVFGWNGEKDIVGRQLLIDIGSICRGELIEIRVNNKLNMVVKESTYYSYWNTDYLSSNSAIFSEEDEKNEILYNYYKKYSKELLALKNLYHPHIQFFPELAYKKIQDGDRDIPFFVTDFRFVSEFFGLVPLCNITKIRIKERPDVIGLSINDRSETEMGRFATDKPEFFNINIYNNTDMTSFKSEVQKFVNNIK